MNKFVSQLLSDGRGGADEQALISLASAAVFLGLQVFVVVHRGQPFDPLSFGAGVGTLLGATSAGFGLRAHLTPECAGDAGPLDGAAAEHQP